MFLIGVDSSFLLLEDAEFLETLASLLSFVKFAFALAILPMFFEHQ